MSQCGRAVSCYVFGMRETEDNLGWRPIIIFAAIAIATFIAYAMWPEWDGYCPDGENSVTCVREWVAASSGWIAAGAAAITVLVLFHQTRQIALFRDADRRDRFRAVMEIVALDLLATAGRLKSMGTDGDGGPSLSQSAIELISDVVSVAPVMSMMLKRHALEVSQVENLMVNPRQPDITGLATYYASRIDRQTLNEVAFRCHLLSLMFLQCAVDIRNTGSIGNHPLREEDIDTLCEKYSVTREKFGYLAPMFAD